MKLKLPLEDLDDLIEINDESQLADDFVNELYLALEPDDLKRVGQWIRDGEEPSLAYRKLAISLLDGDEDALQDYAAVQVGFGLDSIATLDPKKYGENPYYKRVCSKISKVMKKGEWTLSIKSYLPFQLFVCDEVVPSPNDPLINYSPLGFFVQGFSYPALDKNGTTYMSLIPHEIHTMAEPIQKAKGKVLTLGLGMGYFTFMASQKDEVEKVVVLERDRSVIDLFKSVFLPLFDHPEKVEIIQIEDALEYEPKQPFDYAFADLHHDAVDGLPLYLRYLKKDYAAQADFWIEEAVLTYFRRHLIALLEEEADGYGDEDYQNPQGESEEILSRLHFHLKNVEVDNRESLARLLSKESLKAIAKELKA